MRARGIAVVLVFLAAGARARSDNARAAPAGPTETAETEAARFARARDRTERDQAAARLVGIGGPALAPLSAELDRANALAARLRALIATIHPTSEHRQGEAWYEEKFLEAARRVERGDHLGALKVLDAIQTLEPQSPIHDRIDALALRARELLVRASVVEAKLTPKKVLLAPGEPMDVGVEVKNISNAVLELALPAAHEGAVFGGLDVETFDATQNGDRTRFQERQRISTPIQGTLKPGETWKTSVRLHDGPPPASGVFRRVTVTGAIRSKVLVRRDEELDRFLPLFPVEMFVVEAARRPLAADPLRSLAAGIAECRAAKDEVALAKAREAIFFSALLAPPSDRERAIRVLGETLEVPDDPAARGAFAALAAIADRPLDEHRETWRDWVRRRTQ